MRTRYKSLLALLLALVLMICMAACGGNEDEPEEDIAADTQTEEQAGDEESAETAAEAETEKREIVKTIEGVDEDLGPHLPLQIDSIILYDDGSVAVIPLEDLKKNEIKDDAEAVYPFEESGEVSDIYVMDYGNAGYRTIVALLKDGTISAVNGRALVEDHIFAVMDNVGNREGFTDVKNVQEEDAFGIIGISEDGSEVILDYSLNFDEPQ